MIHMFFKLVLTRRIRVEIQQPNHTTPLLVTLLFEYCASFDHDVNYFLLRARRASKLESKLQGLYGWKDGQ